MGEDCKSKQFFNVAWRETYEDMEHSCEFLGKIVVVVAHHHDARDGWIPLGQQELWRIRGCDIGCNRQQDEAALAILNRSCYGGKEHPQEVSAIKVQIHARYVTNKGVKSTLPVV